MAQLLCGKAETHVRLLIARQVSYSFGQPWSAAALPRAVCTRNLGPGPPRRAGVSGHRTLNRNWVSKVRRGHCACSPRPPSRLPPGPETSAPRLTWASSERPRPLRSHTSRSRSSRRRGHLALPWAFPIGKPTLCARFPGIQAGVCQ